MKINHKQSFSIMEIEPVTFACTINQTLPYRTTQASYNILTFNIIIFTKYKQKTTENFACNVSCVCNINYSNINSLYLKNIFFFNTIKLSRFNVMPCFSITEESSLLSFINPLRKISAS